MNTDSVEKPVARRIGRATAVIVLVLLGAAILCCTYRSGGDAAWGPPLMLVVVVLPLWCIWIAFASHLFLRQARGYAKVAVRLLLCLIIAAGSLVGLGTLTKHVATTTRNREVQQAVDQGLYADCIVLLDHWPLEQYQIFPGDVALPSSILAFHPVYITNDVIAIPESGPSNIGLCKNGFGGFAEGLRIFRSDEDARKWSAANGALGQRFAPGIYYWHGST